MLGLNENRAGALQDIDKDALEKRMEKFFDKTLSWEEFSLSQKGLTKTAAGFDPKKVRDKVQKAEIFNAANIVRYMRRPFDVVWAYISDVSPLWNRSRPELRSQFKDHNQFILTRPLCVASPEGIPMVITSLLGEQDSIRGHAYYFPIFFDPESLRRVKKASLHPELYDKDIAESTANLSPPARTYLTTLGLPDPDTDTETAGLIWLHALAVGFAPTYLAENADGIRQDWPRVPLPDTAEALKNSARLGRQVAALLDTENPVPGVTAGTPRPEMKILAVISREGGGPLKPEAGDLALTVGWGHGGKDGITMPGKGKAMKRDYTPEELAAIREGAKALGLTPEQALEHLGESTYDIFLNDVAYWRNVPEKVWTYYIGGYQVIKKWLSYREKPLLGRPLTPDEVEEVTHMARRLAAIVLIEPALNVNYQNVKESCYAWPQS